MGGTLPGVSVPVRVELIRMLGKRGDASRYKP